MSAPCRLGAPDGMPLPEWLPGQSITLRVYPDPAAAPLIRNYSLSNRPGSDEYRISVKQEPHGRGSGYIHAHVKTGDLIDVAAPRGTFFLAEDSRPLVLLSAGVGITPVLSMLHALAAANSAREVWWLHGARDGTENPFAAESRELLNRLPAGISRIAYSQPADADRLGVDYTDRGRLSIAMLGELGVPRDVDVYLCGPVSFMDGLSADLAAFGLDAARIHTETFGAGAALTPGIMPTSTPPHLPAGPPGTGPEIQFARSGISAPFGPPRRTLLEFAEACDVPTRWSCRTGVCHNCETALLSGTVAYDPEPLEPPAEGNILICCSRPSADVVLDL